MHNRLVTNVYNLGLLTMFAIPDIKFALDARDRGLETAFEQYLALQTGGLSRGFFRSDWLFGPGGQGPRIAALAVNEGKKEALRRLQVR